jgi:hypothetical protein
VRYDLNLAHLRGKFLFEMRPDLFTAGTMTDVERGLWNNFFEELQEQRKMNKNGP